MIENPTPAPTSGLILVYTANSIAKEYFKDMRVQSEVLTAHDLMFLQTKMILNVLLGNLFGRPEDELQEDWQESIDFIRTTSEKF